MHIGADATGKLFIQVMDVDCNHIGHIFLYDISLCSEENSCEFGCLMQSCHILKSLDSLGNPLRLKNCVGSRDFSVLVEASSNEFRNLRNEIFYSSRFK